MQIKAVKKLDEKESVCPTYRERVNHKKSFIYFLLEHKKIAMVGFIILMENVKEKVLAASIDWSNSQIMGGLIEEPNGTRVTNLCSLFLNLSGIITVAFGIIYLIKKGKILKSDMPNEEKVKKLKKYKIITLISFIIVVISFIALMYERCI